MARRRTTQWGIQFGTWVSSSGYEWQTVPWVDRDRDVLVPVGQVRKTSAGQLTFHGTPTTHRHRLGLDVARNAVRRFRKLATEITRAEPVTEGAQTVDTGSALAAQGGIAQRLTISEQECQRQILQYADEFGSLWGDAEPRSLRDWQQEASDFLDLYDVSTALRTADFRAFDRHVIETSDPPFLTYWSRRHSSRMMDIAREGEVVTGRDAPNALDTTSDLFAAALNGSSRARARMLLARQINRKLAGGFSLRASLTSADKAFIAPRELVHLLYARIWLDTVNGEAMERQTTCRNCHREIAGTKRKTFCSDQCRWAFNNARRAASR